MNQTFLDQLHGHLDAIKTEVVKDPYNDLADKFDLELDQNSDQWLHVIDGNVSYIPFFPALKARSDDIMKQLEAIDKDSVLPRDLDDIQSWEQCVDWQSEGPPKSACYEGCFYDGCYRPDFTIPAFCEEASGVCTHGVSDGLCEGVPNFSRYDGMEKTFEGSDKESFCFEVLFFGSVRIAQCPEPDLTSSMKTSGAAPIHVKENSFLLGVMIITFLF